MSAFFTLFSTLAGGLAAVAAKLGLSATALAFLGPLAPIISGIGQLIGAAVTAVGEILASLSKSAEGRITLCLAAALLGFLYLRYHYIEEGKALAKPKIVTIQKPCPAPRTERRVR